MITRRRDAVTEQDKDKRDEGKKRMERQREDVPCCFWSVKVSLHLCDNSSWRSSVKSRPLRYPTTSRITMLFTAVSLYLNSNLPLQITPSVHQHNSRPTIKVTTDKETVHTDGRTHGNGRLQKLVCRVQEAFKLHQSHVRVAVCTQSSGASEIAFVQSQYLSV